MEGPKETRQWPRRVALSFAFSLYAVVSVQAVSAALAQGAAGERPISATTTLAAIGYRGNDDFVQPGTSRPPMEGSLDVDEERRRELLDRIRYMATSGLYADHTAIFAQLSLNINYPLVSDALRMKFSRPTSTRC